VTGGHAQLRKFLSGFGTNLRAKQRKKKEKLEKEIDHLDRLAEADKLDAKG
jgi:hypothetical protein